MPKATYTGPHTAVDVPALGIEGAANGQPIDVTEPQATILTSMANWTVEGDPNPLDPPTLTLKEQKAAKAAAAKAKLQANAADPAPAVTDTANTADTTALEAEAEALRAQAAALEAQAANGGK